MQLIIIELANEGKTFSIVPAAQQSSVNSGNVDYCC